MDQRVDFANLFPDVLTEESIANVAQGLLLSNGKTISDLVSMTHSRFLRSIANVTDNTSVVDSLFDGILGRKPDADEVIYCSGYINHRIENRDQAIESLAWALITSAEFRFNH